MWITAQIGIDRVLRTSRSLGIRTPLQRYPTTALGASETNLLELANAYRTMASGHRGGAVPDPGGAARLGGDHHRAPASARAALD